MLNVVKYVHVFDQVIQLRIRETNAEASLAMKRNMTTPSPYKAVG